MLLRALSRCFLNSDRLGASTTSLGILYQYLTALSIKKCFLMFSLNSSWSSFEPLPCPVTGSEEEEIHTSLSASSSHLYLSPVLLCPRCRIQHLDLFHFIPFITAQCPSYLDPSGRHLVSQKSQQHLSVWDHQQIALGAFTSFIQIVDKNIGQNRP